MEELVTAVFSVVVTQTGRIVFWVVSFGRWHGEQLLKEEGRTYGSAGALSFVCDGQRVLADTGLLFVGIVFYVALLLAGVACTARV